LAAAPRSEATVQAVNRRAASESRMREPGERLTGTGGSGNEDEEIYCRRS
jgi:hypothetical protein